MPCGQQVLRRGKSDSGKVIRLHLRLPSLLPLPESFLPGKAALRCLIRASGLRHRGSRQRRVLNSGWGGSRGRLRFVSGAFSLPGSKEMSKQAAEAAPRGAASARYKACSGSDSFASWHGWVPVWITAAGIPGNCSWLREQQLSSETGADSSPERWSAAAAAAEAGLVPEQPASPGAGREAGQELASN